jgi:glutamate-1-semialdehyde aminotransferase
MEDTNLLQVIIGAASIAINALAGFALWMIRGRLRDKDLVISDLKQERNTLREELEECHERHQAAHRTP